MARSIPLKGTISSNNQPNGPKLSKAAFGVVNNKGKIDIDELGVFLLNPDSWEESKSSNWATSQIQGQSDPILQWTSGGPRVVTFDATVTLETSDLGTIKRSPADQLKSAAINAVGSIASSFFGANVPPLGDFFSSSPAGTNLSISDHLDYYRSLLYPIYNTNGRLTQSPPLIVLYVGNVFSCDSSSKEVSLSPEIETWVITNLRIKVTKQLMNLDPMEAIVSFQLMEYVITSRQRSDFVFTEDSSSGITDNLPTNSKTLFDGLA